MTSFEAKIGWKRLRKRENKNYRFVSSLHVEQLKIQKKLKKLKNTIMTLFQSKIGWQIMRQRENKNYRSVSSLPDT